jgi:hypothetical protein
MARMARAFVFAVVLVAWTFEMGCSGTGENQGTLDGEAMTPRAQSDAAIDASGLGGGCLAAGGRCQGTAITCTAFGAYGCGSNAVCCFDNICAPDKSSQVIMASSYDQSCTVDSDCVGVAQGDSCRPCDFTCINATINTGALAKYTSDTKSLPAVLAVAKGACPSSCGGPEGVCCRGGKCIRSFQCLNIADAGAEAQADAGDATTDAGADAATDAAADANAE